MNQYPEKDKLLSNEIPIMIIKGLTVIYGHVEAVKGIDLEVRKGKITALLGANGAGKSSTLQAIAGLIPSQQDEFKFKDMDCRGRPPEFMVKNGLSLTPEGRRVFASLTVEENLKLGGFVHRKDKRAISETIEEIFYLFPILKVRLNQFSGTLSGGERQQLAIARSLMSSPELLLLDEPTLGLAPKIVSEIFRLILDLKDKQKTILLVEQNVEMSLGVADYGFVMTNGVIAAKGKSEELKSTQKIKRVYLGKHKA
jgi:branched-chain amino acid transport system ATP-binding protein